VGKLATFVVNTIIYGSEDLAMFDNLMISLTTLLLDFSLMD
jgi:hypothetical protein